MRPMLNPRIELGALTDWLRERCSSSSGLLVDSFEDEGFRICSDDREEEGFGSGWLPLRPRLKLKGKSLACSSMSDSFIRFIVLCRTLQEWHTVRCAIEEDKKCWSHRKRTFLYTRGMVGQRAELEKKVVVDHISRSQSRSCRRPPHGYRAHVDSRHPVRPNFFVWAAETSCDDKTRRAHKANKKKTKLGERRGVRSNLRTYVSYAPGYTSSVTIEGGCISRRSVFQINGRCEWSVGIGFKEWVPSQDRWILQLKHLTLRGSLP